MNDMQSNDTQRSIALERLQIASVALAVSAIFAFGSVFASLVHSVVAQAFPDVIEQGWYKQAVSMVPMYLLAMPLSLLLFALGKAEPPTRRRMRPTVFAALLALCFGVTYFGNFVGMWFGSLLERVAGIPFSNAVEQLTMPAPLWSNLLFIGILAPVMEEIFYRKLMIDRLRRFGELPALLISGVGFGLIHGNFSQFFYAAMIGIVFGYIYLRTGSILHTVLLHMAINLIGGVYTTEMYRLLDSELFLSDPSAALAKSSAGALMYWIYAAFFVCVCIAAVVSLVFLLRKWYRAPECAHAPLSRMEWVRVLALNPAIWIFLCVVLMLFLN